MWINIDKSDIPIIRELIWEYPELASKTFTSDSIFIDTNNVKYNSNCAEYNITDDIVLQYQRSSSNKIYINFIDYNKQYLCSSISGDVC